MNTVKKHRRVVLTGNGSTENLTVVEEAIPEPGPNEVRIRVLAAGVAYSDVMAQHGGYPLAPKVPFTPRYDFAGIVDRVARTAVGIEAGDYVVALNPAFGCYSEYVCVRPELLVAVPEEVDAAAVVSLALNYLTAHCILHRKAHIQRNETVLIHAAAGGVGTALLQLGKLLDLKMYGTASVGKHATVREFGGIPIDYRNQDFLEYIKDQTEGVDAAFDPFGGDNLRRSYKALKKGGRLVSYGFAGDHFGGLGRMILGVVQMSSLNIWPDGKRVCLCATPGEAKNDNAWYRATMSELIAMLARGQIKPVIGARVPITEVKRAHELVEQSEVSGKVVLV